MKLNEKLTIVLGIALVGIFLFGLAWSISTGLAGFWKGLPFWIIVIFCLCLLIYDSYKSIKQKKDF
jgi:sterol desaturase/sphingolipid hydroxylase (fatty acid hydroxylase superfamily)